MVASCTNWTSPKLAKPSPPTASLDVSMPTLISMPVRSRIAYAYSALVNLRTVTRPGSPAYTRLVLAQRRTDPRRRGGALRIARKRLRIVRRHLARLEHFGDVLPRLRLIADRRRRHVVDQACDAQASLRLVDPVAFDAILREGLGRRGPRGRRPWPGGGPVVARPRGCADITQTSASSRRAQEPSCFIRTHRARRPARILVLRESTCPLALP